VSRPRILIVDDEADIRSSLKMILEYEEMEPVEAADGNQALALAAESAPDAVLLDIKMQGMDGLEVLAELRRLKPELPVVMISGHGTIATAIEATKLGAFDFMEKPLERERVLLVLRNALQQRRCRHDHPRDAETTLHGSLREEALLERCWAVDSETFDRSDDAPVGLNGQHQTAIHRPVVENHRTGSAVAVGAAFFGPGKVENVAEHFQQRLFRLTKKLFVFTVDCTRYDAFICHLSPSSGNLIL